MRESRQKRGGQSREGDMGAERGGGICRGKERGILMLADEGSVEVRR